MKTSIKLVHGNLIDAWLNQEIGFAGHGANCFGTMYSGIAGQITQRIPEVAKVDRRAFENHQTILGGATAYWTDQGKEGAARGFFNLYSQYHPGPCATVQACVSSLQAARFMMKAYAANPDAPIGIPQIGCGIGGLTWANVEKALMNAQDIGELVVYVYNPAPRAHLSN